MKRVLICGTLVLLSLQSNAETIQVKVNTKEKNVAALGFSVEGRESGSPGRFYSGKGPKNKEYRFGYRRALYSKNITCGSLVLTKDSLITLVIKEDQCSIVATSP